jgi:hypothetical protein
MILDCKCNVYFSNYKNISDIFLQQIKFQSVKYCIMYDKSLMLIV